MKSQAVKAGQESGEQDKSKGIRDDIEEEDVEESYYRYESND